MQGCSGGYTRHTPYNFWMCLMELRTPSVFQIMLYYIYSIYECLIPRTPSGLIKNLKKMAFAFIKRISHAVKEPFIGFNLK